MLITESPDTAEVPTAVPTATLAATRPTDADHPAGPEWLWILLAVAVVGAAVGAVFYRRCRRAAAAAGLFLGGARSKSISQPRDSVGRRPPWPIQCLLRRRPC